MKLNIKELKKELKERSRIRTHWTGCYLDPKHRDCAIHLLIEEVESLDRMKCGLQDGFLDLSARNKELREEVERANHEGGLAVKQVVDLMSERDALKAEVEELQEVIKEFPIDGHR